MKKILAIGIAWCLSLNAIAQLSGGLKGGLNLTSQKWEIKIQGESDSESFEGTGFHIGGYINRPLSDVVSLQPELIFNVLKADLDGEDFTMNYISVPVMLGYAFEKNQFVLQGGPQLGVLLSTDPGEFKDEGYISGIDFSLNLGAQLNFNKFNLSIRYSIGLSNIAEDKMSDDLEAVFGTPVDLTIKNNNLQFSVGYKLFGN
jgi:hypothetical protein